MTFSHWISKPFPATIGSFLDCMPAAKQATWKSLFNCVNLDTNAGVVAFIHLTRQHYWRHWQEFLPPGLDLHLQDLALAEWVTVLQSFARCSQEGAFSHRKQVKVGSIQTALGTIGKNIKLAGFANPLHQPGTTNYYVALTLQMEAYCQTNPDTHKQVAVPLYIKNFIYHNTCNTDDHQVKAIGELALISFYFLLWVGEYTHHGGSSWQMQQFWLCNLKFFTKGHEIQPEKLTKLAGQIDLMSMMIYNQKNGWQGQTLSHHAGTGKIHATQSAHLFQEPSIWSRMSPAQHANLCIPRWHGSTYAVQIWLKLPRMWSRSWVTNPMVLMPQK